MHKNALQTQHKTSVAKRVERYAKNHPGSLLRAADFPHDNPVAVSKALSRLKAAGKLQSAAKGVYYAPKPTLLGPSRPTASSVMTKALPGRVRPTGVTAANLLGLSTQVAARPQMAVYSQSHLADSSMRTKRRKGNPSSLSPEDAALLEVLRDRGRFSELSEEETTLHVLVSLAKRVHGTTETNEIKLLSVEVQRLSFTTKDAAPRLHVAQNLQKLVKAALTEPPRVRAMLGALLDSLNAPNRLLKPLRDSLNPLSKFDFGTFRVLPNAKEWQAK